MNNLVQKSVYRCPICHTDLNKGLPAQSKSFTCLNSHNFDIAKEGYVNLLPVQFKQSKNPGDNKAMVNARRAFLEQGYYQTLVDKLYTLYIQYTEGKGTFFDAGCGEGFYTHQHKTDSNSIYGVDIAKEAVKKAAKKYTSCNFSVATLSQLPFNDKSFNWLLSIYAPILEEEFTRVLAEKGYLITVTPAKKHLYELKAIIYNNVQEHDIEKDPIKDLQIIHQEQLTYSFTMKSGTDTLNLLSMTPFAFKATEQVKEKLRQQENFTCQADFLIRVYQKN